MKIYGTEVYKEAVDIYTKENKKFLWFRWEKRTVFVAKGKWTKGTIMQFRKHTGNGRKVSPELNHFLNNHLNEMSNNR